jgi:hypothetical protein
MKITFTETLSPREYDKDDFPNGLNLAVSKFSEEDLLTISLEDDDESSIFSFSLSLESFNETFGVIFKALKVENKNG